MICCADTELRETVQHSPGVVPHIQMEQCMPCRPFYLSPELCEDKPYNEKTDIWAIGVCMVRTAVHCAPSCPDSCTLLCSQWGGRQSNLHVHASRQLEHHHQYAVVSIM